MIILESLISTFEVSGIFYAAIIGLCHKIILEDLQLQKANLKMQKFVVNIQIRTEVINHSKC